MLETQTHAHLPLSRMQEQIWMRVYWRMVDTPPQMQALSWIAGHMRQTAASASLMRAAVLMVEPIPQATAAPYGTMVAYPIQMEGMMPWTGV